MGKVATFSSAGAIAMQKVPTYCDLVWVVLIHTSKAAAACACGGKARAWLVYAFHALSSSASLSGRPSVVKSQVSIPWPVASRGIF